MQSDQLHERLFIPQTVPAFAATESFNYLRKRYPDYAYKEATLNPTNLRDRAADWESDVINSFRNNSSRQELMGERNTPTGRERFFDRDSGARGEGISVRRRLCGQVLSVDGVSRDLLGPTPQS